MSRDGRDLSMSASGEPDWLQLNRANWDARVPIHTAPGGYNLANFDDPEYLSGVVRFDLPRLGPLQGLDVVHIQCHIGTDTVSLARLGAASVTGMDFSSVAIAAARELASRAATRVNFVEGNVYDAVQLLGGERFDLVYTGVGALCWLPSITRWAQVVAGLLRPGGRLFIREAHPILWTLSEHRSDGLLVIEHPYFETEGVVFRESASYIGDGTMAADKTVHFNHGMAEIITALMTAGLTLNAFEEHRSVPWKQLDEMVRTDNPKGEYVLGQARDRLPCTYTLQACKAR